MLRRFSVFLVISLVRIVPTCFAESLEDRTLMEIVGEQQRIFQTLARNPDYYVERERDRRLNELAKNYETFLSQNPKHFDALVLYGKFLRSVGHGRQALQYFLRADALESAAVVKQQIANCLAEERAYPEALIYILAAIDLSPNEAVYHYQLGELLVIFKKNFIRSHIFSAEVVDGKILEAFRTAVRLAPKEKTFRMRYAEAHFDVSAPNWKEALDLWNQFGRETVDPKEQDWIRFNRARVLLNLGLVEASMADLQLIFRPDLETARRILMAAQLKTTR